MVLRRLGVFLHVTKDGLIIARSALKDPRRIVGAIVYDAGMRRIGVVVDVIGSVESPYIVVRPESKNLLSIIEPGPLYYYVERRRERRQPRRTRPRKRGARRGGSL